MNLRMFCAEKVERSKKESPDNYQYKHRVA